MKRSNLIALELRLSRTVWDAVYEAEDVDDKDTKSQFSMELLVKL